MPRGESRGSESRKQTPRTRGGATRHRCEPGPTTRSPARFGFGSLQQREVRARSDLPPGPQSCCGGSELLKDHLALQVAGELVHPEELTVIKGRQVVDVDLTSLKRGDVQ